MVIDLMITIALVIGALLIGAVVMFILTEDDDDI